MIYHRDVEHKLELGTNTMNSMPRYIVMIIWTTTVNINKNCKQMQKNYNVVGDDVVIKPNLSSIQKNTITFEEVSTGLTDKYYELKS